VRGWAWRDVLINVAYFTATVVAVVLLMMLLFPR